MKKTEKENKRVLDASIFNHRNEMRQKMKELRWNNSKSYWKIFNLGCLRNNQIIILAHFELNETPDNIENDYDLLNIELHFINTPNMEINGQIPADEISKSVKDLKIEKTYYDDNIINEYIKSSAYLLMPIYVILFNCILVPDTWLSGNIIPIFKNKEKSSDPKNYKLISILSSQRKHSTSMFNRRLNADSDEFVLINESQVGFRHKYSTNENIISFRSILITLKKKEMFCVFMNFDKSLRYCLERGFMVQITHESDCW